MTFIQITLLYFSATVSTLYLIAGGWVAVRNWFKTKAAAKAEAAQAAAKDQADKIEAAVQERLKKLQAETEAAPESTATSAAGAVTA